VSGGFGDLYLAIDKPEVMLRRVVVKVLQEKALEDKMDRHKVPPGD